MLKDSIIFDYQPMLICLVETPLQKEKEIRIPGYSQIFRNDRSRNSESITLAVQNIKQLRQKLLRKRKLDKACGHC